MIKNKKLLKVTATSLAILTSISAGLVAIKLMRKSPYEYEEITASYSSDFDENNIFEDITELTTENITYEEEKEEPITIETVTEPTTKKVVEEEKQDLTDYYEIKQKLDAVLNKKGFDDNTKEVINIIVDKLYYNYDSVKSIYEMDGMRDKNKYINDFIDTLEKNVDDFIYVKSGAADIYSIKLGSNSAIYSTIDEKIVINTNLFPEELVSVNLHEITHSQQRKILNDRKIPNGIRTVLVEGEATASSILLESSMPFFSNLVVSNENDTVSYFISGLSDTNYSAFSKYYMMLGHAAGFDALQKMKEDGYNKDYLIRAIESRYDIDGRKFIDDMDTSASIITRTYQSDELILSTGDLEKSYLSILSQDIEKANSKESIQNVMNLYRHYKLQYKMLAYDNNYGDIENAFGEKDVEKNLYNKVLQLGVLPDGIEFEIFNLMMFNYIDFNPYFVKDTSIYDLRYRNDGDQIIFIGKSSEDMMRYDMKTKKITNDIATKEIYDSCDNVFSKTSLVKSR